jgi:predicted nucleotidyltransferase
MGSPPSDRVAEALFGSTRRQVLALFFGRPMQAFYLRQIVRETGAGVGSVQRELRRLLSAGLVTRVKAGNQVHYTVNRGSPVFPELQSLITKTVGIGDVLLDSLSQLRKRKFIKVAFVYGSVAAGKHSAQSDVDLMIVGDIDLADLLPMLRGAQEHLGREINPTVYDAKEFREKARMGGNLVSRVLSAPRIIVVGTDDDLEKLVGQPPASHADGRRRIARRSFSLGGVQ